MPAPWTSRKTSAFRKPASPTCSSASTRKGSSSTRNTAAPSLTEEGHRIALAIIERHETLTRFLRLFGIDEETIYKDVEGMEHHVSRPTLKVISAVADALEADPALLKKVRADCGNTSSPL